MCMTKNDLINDVIAGLSISMNQEQVDMVKAIFIVKMQGYEIYEINTLPSTEVVDNDYILKRFTIDMLAKGLKESSIKAYLNIIRPFIDHTGISFTDVTAQHRLSCSKKGFKEYTWAEEYTVIYSRNMQSSVYILPVGIQEASYKPGHHA